MQEFLSEVLTPGSVFYDIGANVGFFAVLAASKVTSSGRVYAFEPLPENLTVLRRNIELNGFDNVDVRPIAVGAERGTASLWLGQERTPGRLTYDNSAPEGRWKRTSVQVTTIDDEVSAGRISPPDVVKIDIEGGEVLALQGMEKTLRQHRPIVLCELHGTNSAVAEVLESAGYRLSVLEMEQSVQEAAWWVHVVARPC